MSKLLIDDSDRLLVNNSGKACEVGNMDALIGSTSPATITAAAGRVLKLLRYGKCEQSGTPTPDNPADIVCNNGVLKVFVGNKWTDTDALSGYIIPWDTGTISGNANYMVSAPILLRAGDYDVSYVSDATGSRPFSVWECDASGTLVQDGGIFTIGRPRVGVNAGTFTIDSDKYVRMSWRKTFTDISVAPSSPILYADGSAEVLSLEGAHSYQTASVKDLLAVGDYIDEQDVISGRVTRKVGVASFNGSENWVTMNYGYSTDVIDDFPNVGFIPLCTHFMGKNSASAATDTIRIYFTSGGVPRTYFFVDKTVDDFSTVDKFTAWLASQYAAGTPVIVVYPLATPTTENVTPQPLNTTAGSNTFADVAEISNPKYNIIYKI